MDAKAPQAHLILLLKAISAHDYKAGDEIIVSEQEHHANFIPWLMLAEQTGAKIIRWPIEDNFLPSIATLATLLTARTRVVAISQMSEYHRCTNRLR